MRKCQIWQINQIRNQPTGKININILPKTADQNASGFMSRIPLDAAQGHWCLWHNHQESEPQAIKWIF